MCCLGKVLHYQCTHIVPLAQGACLDTIRNFIVLCVLLMILALFVHAVDWIRWYLYPEHEDYVIHI